MGDAGREVGPLIPTKSKICIDIYSQPSVSMVPHPQIQPISDHTVGHISREKCTCKRTNTVQTHVVQGSKVCCSVNVMEIFYPTSYLSNKLSNKFSIQNYLSNKFIPWGTLSLFAIPKASRLGLDSCWTELDRTDSILTRIKAAILVVCSARKEEYYL